MDAFCGDCGARRVTNTAFCAQCGRRFPADSTGASSTPRTAQTSPYPGSPGPPQGYGYQPGPPPPQGYGYHPGPSAPAGPSQRAGSGFSTGAIICGAIAFLFLPIILGPIGLILAAVAKSKGERNANIGFLVAGLGTVVGMILGALVFANSF